MISLYPLVWDLFQAGRLRQLRGGPRLRDPRVRLRPRALAPRPAAGPQGQVRPPEPLPLLRPHYSRMMGFKKGGTVLSVTVQCGRLGHVSGGSLDSW